MGLESIKVNNNKVVDVDKEPISGSENLINSGSVYKTLGEKYDIKDTFIQLNGTPKYIAGCGWNCTDFIPVLPGSIIDITVETNYQVSIIAFYNKTKQFISNITTDSQEIRITYSDTITVPDDIYYIRSSAFLYGENLPHSLIISQIGKIIENLQY